MFFIYHAIEKIDTILALLFYYTTIYTHKHARIRTCKYINNIKSLQEKRGFLIYFFESFTYFETQKSDNNGHKEQSHLSIKESLEKAVEA